MFLFKSVKIKATKIRKEKDMDTMKRELGDKLENNIITLRAMMSNSSDLTIKYAMVAGVDIAVIFCEGMASTSTMAELIFYPLNGIGPKAQMPLDEMIKTVRDQVLLAGEQKSADNFEDVILGIMSGFVVILINGYNHGISIGVQGYSSRSVEQPSSHSNIRGARDSFVETVRTNVSLLRRRMKTPDLVFEMLTLGDVSNTDVCLCYIKGKADKKLIQGVKERLEQLPLSAIIEGGSIQPFLENKGDGVFSEIGATERPDVLSAKLFDGRVGVIVDGTPFVLYLPHLFNEYFTTVDDYTGRRIFSIIIRILRYVAFFSAVMLPGFYVALANFSPELFPNSLLLNLSSSIQETPYQLLPECLIIHVFFELMREAGLRIPSNIGHAISIVGGLVIGDIVVSAGLVGAPLVLVVAISAITSFVIPDLYDSIVIMRFAFIFAGGLFGLFGIAIASGLFLIKICSTGAYGVPMSAPVSPFSLNAARDIVYRAPWRKLAKKDVKIQDLNGVKINNGKN